MTKLTKRAIDALEPDANGRDRFIWDSDLKGFGVRVMPSAVATFLVQYRNAEGRTRRLSLGKVGTLTPDEARSLAREKLAAAAKGSDPSAERHKLRNSLTVAELCRAYQEAAKLHIKPSTAAMDRSRIERHVLPLIGRLKVSSLTRSDVTKLQTDIAAGKSIARKTEGEAKRRRGGIASGGQGVAARTIGMLGTILEFAKAHGLVSENVARGVRKYSGKRRDRFLSVREIKSLGEAIQLSTESAVALDAVRTLLLTGCRRMEVLALRNAEVDVDARCFRFNDTKSGAQVRPIGASAFAVLGRRLKESRGVFIFPSPIGDGHFVGLPRVVARLFAAAGIADASIHTLRHTFASTAAELGFSQLVIAGLLGHSVPGITARYAHLPDRALLMAADQVSARLLWALEGEKTISVQTVVALRSAS